MGILLQEVLRRLCIEIGWSYAVFWRGIGCGDLMHLVWEDGHCEQTSRPAISGFEAMDLLIKDSVVLRSSHDGRFAELGCQAEDRVRMLVYKLMPTQVHVVGDGLVGKAALTGNHEWVLGDILNDNGSISKDLAEMSQQFLAGIQTLAIIPVLPHGIVQLGSTRMLMENIGFINHVKSLFEQLGCLPGDLLSNTTQKTLSQKTQLHAPFGLQTSVDQFGYVGTNINSLSSLNVGNSNGQPFIYSDTRAITQPSCALSTQLCDKKPGNVPEASLAKENITSTMMTFSSFSQPLVMPIVRLNSQLESGCQGAQAVFSNPEACLIRNVLPHDSSSGIQYQPPVGLSSSRLTSLEEQLLFLSGIRSQEFANNNEPTSVNNNMLQLQSHGCTSLNSLKDSDIISSFGRSELLNSANDLRRISSFPSGTTVSIKNQRALSSSIEVHQVLNPTNQLTFSQMTSRDLEPSHPTFIDKKSRTVSSAEKQKKDNDLFQALEGPSTEFDEHGSCYRTLLGTLQDGPVQKNRRYQNSACAENDMCTAPNKGNNKGNEKSDFLHALDEKTSPSPLHSSSGNDLFDVLRLDHSKSVCSHGILDDVLVHSTAANAVELSTDVSTCMTQLDVGTVFDALNEICYSGMFSEASSDQLLDAVVSQINPGAKQDMDDNASCKTSLTKISSSSFHTNSSDCGWVASSEQMRGEIFGLSPVLVKSETAGSSSVKSSCSMERTEGCFSQRDGGYKSQISLWAENGQNMNCDSISAAHCKRVDEVGKLNRKRFRPGENPRPRPKDRQMIQDRVKELREIVPNGAKCSIDALLEKTIKHMLFLQSVTKHADKLKETGEPKIGSKEGGLLLKDNFEGGVTWAFEVGQSMICPIVVEDLNPPRQMLVEMLCEERGLFLEIADLVKGLGLTILKGVMEARNDKVWARFAVEANRDVTRMEIFFSLVQLLEPTVGSIKAPEGIDNLNKPHNMFHPSSSIPATGLSDRL